MAGADVARGVQAGGAAGVPVGGRTRDGGGGRTGGRRYRAADGQGGGAEAAAAGLLAVKRRWAFVRLDNFDSVLDVPRRDLVRTFYIKYNGHSSY